MSELYLVRVRLRKPGRVFSFLAEALELDPGDDCMVKSDRGLEFGTVVGRTETLTDEQARKVGMSVVRKANAEDLNVHQRLVEKEAKAREVCLRKIEERELPMKLVDVEYTFNQKKVIFYFTSEERVDFRELVKDLAYEFKMRIELRQIGVRDEARMIGGMGCCGRPLCCTTFLHDFEPVSIKMAKRQNLALNPSKISGLCGRLMCCILFEDKMYQEAHARKCACRKADDKRREDEPQPAPAE
jgi:cell fate regulator YaaT (PSP1 superfamily)